MGKLINVNTALLARDLGFNIHCDWRFDEENNNELINWKDFRVKECIEYDRCYAYKAVEYLENNYYDTFDNKEIGFYLAAPTQSVLQEWLRDVHEINVFVFCYGFGYYPIHDNIPLPTSKVEYVDRRWNVKNELNLGFNTYEEALEIGLFEALKLILKK